MKDAVFGLVLPMLLLGLGLLAGLLAGTREEGSRKLWAVPVCLASGGLILLLAFWSIRLSTGSPLIISELCPDNFSLLADESGNYGDYIELYNQRDYTIDLSGYCLSDDRDNLEKYPLPPLELAPGESVLIWADGSDLSPEGELHACFKIAPGETVFLSNAQGEVLQALTPEVSVANISLTFFSGSYIAAYGTPGQSNVNCKPYRAATLEAPCFSLPCGFYAQEKITLELQARTGYAIHYTTDGSTPDEASPVYTSPLTLTDPSSQPNQYVSLPNTVINYNAVETDNTPVPKANVVRAIAIDREGNFSPVVTATYFVGDAAKEYEGAWVLSVVSHPEGLFGADGICVTGQEYDHWYLKTDQTSPKPTANFDKKGRQWEREAHVQLWNDTGDLLLDQACGMRVQGNSSRQFATKRFRFYAREHYSGSDFFETVIFPSGELSHTFATRPDDGDMITQDLLRDRELSCQEGIPVVCFLDGEFYVSTYIRQCTDNAFFAQRYGVQEDTVAIVEQGRLDEGTSEDLKDYEALLELMTQGDMTDPAVYARIQSQIDTQSLADFLAATLYGSNLDVSLTKNFKLWRVTEGTGEGYADGRWRVVAYDMDAVVWGYLVRTEDEFVDIDPFRYCLEDAEKYGANQTFLIRLPFFQNLLKNDSFKEQFIRAYLDMMNTNFSMDSHGGAVYARYPGIREDFWPAFLTQRQSYAIEHLKYAFDITEPNSTVTISTEGKGTVSVGTTQAYTQIGTWTGTYISGMELKLTAEADEGWVFAGWQGDCFSADATQTFLLEEKGLNLKAVFVPEDGAR